MSARERILARVAAATGAGDSAPGSIEAALRTTARGPAPPPSQNQVSSFCERARGLASDVIECTGIAQVPAEVARYMDARRLPRQAVCWPELAALPWQAAGIRVETRAGRADSGGRASAFAAELVGITGAFCAIAETGTLMLLSGPETPATVSLLPETHIAVLESGRLVATMEDAWDRLRAERGVPPRAVNLVSGPSRTADIEQTVTLGAHGPYRVCILLVNAAPSQSSVEPR